MVNVPSSTLGIEVDAAGSVVVGVGELELHATTAVISALTVTATAHVAGERRMAGL